MDRFDGLQTQVLGLSVDSVPCLTAWAESLGGITYPLLSDFFPHGHVAECYGVLRQEGYSERALFIVDRQGIIRYVDVHKIDEQPDNDVLFAALEQIEPEAAARMPAKPAAAPEPVGDVVMYCTPWCPDCRRARAYFLERQIAVAEVDISRDRAAAQRVKGWAGGNETTPTFSIKGRIVVGFDKAKLEELLPS